jgi:hypothetical protein
MILRKLKTWLVIGCRACGEVDKVPTHFRHTRAAKRFATRPDLFFCGECEGPVELLSVRPMGERMRNIVNLRR